MPAKKTPRKYARPRTLTKEFIQNAVTLSTSLASDKALCRALGCSPTSWCRWKTRAEQGKEPEARMFNQINEAKGLKSISLISSIGTDPDWRAKAWLLERLEPETFSLRHRHEISGPGGKPLAAAAASIMVVVQGEHEDNPYLPAPKEGK